MKVSEHWLREWIDPPFSAEQIAEKLTMAGLEVEEVALAPNEVDSVFDISITPNRGDCLSVLGLSIELAAITQAEVCFPAINNVNPQSSETRAVKVLNPSECPRYAGRIIHNVQADAITPDWILHRLQCANVSCISPVVDVMNYVMLELGQPMHAFDLDKINQTIIVRSAKANEELTLLDGTTVKLAPETLVIADQTKLLAIAGVMGGLDSAVTLSTKHVFLESAFFSPATIAKTARTYNLNSDSSYRFERGIDPVIQVRALERATELLLEIVGGEAGPITEIMSENELPQEAVITLAKEKIKKLLGIEIPVKEIESMFHQLGFIVQAITQGWKVTVPARRSDIKLDVDLIEEVARLYGYDKIPQHFATVPLSLPASSTQTVNVSSLRQRLCDLGYQEVITYSFIDPVHQQLFDKELQPKELLNPITADMAVMRTSLWPGLVNTLLYNQNRQQTRARLFETGLRFIPVSNSVEAESLIQEPMLSGLINGNVFPEQWGRPKQEVDFFDLKGDLQNIIKLSNCDHEIIFKAGKHPALHPGQTATIYRQDQLIGILGALHPSLVSQLGIQGKTYLFELSLKSLLNANLPKVEPISKFPEIRRDIAILVDKTIPSKAIQDTIIKVAGEFLRDVNLFDVYEGKGIAPDRKSIALGLVLQHASRTLIDEEVANTMDRVITVLKNKFAAELRGSS